MGNWNRIVFLVSVLLTILFWVIAEFDMIPDRKLIYQGWVVMATLATYLFSVAMTIMREEPEKRPFLFFQISFLLVLLVIVVIFIAEKGLLAEQEAHEEAVRNLMLP